MIQKLLLPLFLLLLWVSNAQTPGEWTWMAGSIINAIPEFGTQGVPSSLNTPGAHYEGACWTDHDGNFWLYGMTIDDCQNLWKYDVSTNMWTWMNGPGSLCWGIPTLGTQGVFSSSVVPTIPGLGEHAEWVDNNGDLWLFHCETVTNTSFMFKYSMTLNQWAFMHGNTPVNYGTLGVPDPLVNPSLQESPVSWVDNSGDLWLYSAAISSMFKFNIATNMWTRMNGDGVSELTSVIGILGQYSAMNRPRSGDAFQHWRSDDGTFYKFGCYSITGNPFSPTIVDNQMWQFNPSINQWRVVHAGDPDNTSSFSSNCTFSSSNRPSRYTEKRVSWKDECNRFYGLDNSCDVRVWSFDPSINQYSLIGSVSSPDCLPVYGTQGVSSPANVPSVDVGDASWTDNSGSFWRAGEEPGIDYLGSNALWRYVPDISCLSSVIANFTPSPQQGCAPLTVNFQPQDTSSTLSFHWDFGDASTSSDTSILGTPTYTFLNPGNYTVQLIISGSGSCGSGTDTTEMQITVVTPPVLSLSNDTTLCEGMGVSLFASGASSYSWSPGSGLNTTVGASVLASPTVSTMYTVSGTTSGCTSSDSVLVSINSLPVLSVSDTFICLGDTATLTVSGALTYSWSPASGLSTTVGTPVQASPSSTSIYTITGTDANSCVNTQQVTVTVETLNVIVNSAILCANDPSSFVTLTAGGADSYTWSPATGLSSTTGSSVTSNVDLTTVYTVTGTTTNGCIDSAFSTVTVIPFFDVMVNSADICSGESTMLSASGADTYLWSPETGLSSTTGTEVICSPLLTTTYTVTGTLNGCVDGANATVTVYALPEATIQVNPNPVSIANPVVVFSTQANGNTVAWSHDDELISNFEQFTHQFTEDQPGSYEFTLVLTNNLGCSDTAKITVIVQEDLIFYVPNSFTPDGDEFNNSFHPVISSGIDLKSYEMQIYNRWGETVFQTKSFEDYWDGTYNGESCPDGTYTWKIAFKSKYNDKRFEYVGHVIVLK